MPQNSDIVIQTDVVGAEQVDRLGASLDASALGAASLSNNLRGLSYASSGIPFQQQAQYAQQYAVSLQNVNAQVQAAAQQRSLIDRMWTPLNYGMAGAVLYHAGRGMNAGLGLGPRLAQTEWARAHGIGGESILKDLGALTGLGTSQVAAGEAARLARDIQNQAREAEKALKAAKAGLAAAAAGGGGAAGNAAAAAAAGAGGSGMSRFLSGLAGGAGGGSLGRVGLGISGAIGVGVAAFAGYEVIKHAVEYIEDYNRELRETVILSNQLGLGTKVDVMGNTRYNPMTALRQFRLLSRLEEAGGAPVEQVAETLQTFRSRIAIAGRPDLINANPEAQRFYETMGKLDIPIRRGMDPMDVYYKFLEKVAPMGTFGAYQYGQGAGANIQGTFQDIERKTWRTKEIWENWGPQVSEDFVRQMELAHQQIRDIKDWFADIKQYAGAIGESVKMWTISQVAAPFLNFFMPGTVRASYEGYTPGQMDALRGAVGSYVAMRPTLRTSVRLAQVQRDVDVVNRVSQLMMTPGATVTKEDLDRFLTAYPSVKQLPIATRDQSRAQIVESMTTNIEEQRRQFELSRSSGIDRAVRELQYNRSLLQEQMKEQENKIAPLREKFNTVQAKLQSFGPYNEQEVLKWKPSEVAKPDIKVTYAAMENPLLPMIGGFGSIFSKQQGNPWIQGVSNEEIKQVQTPEYQARMKAIQDTLKEFQVSKASLDIANQGGETMKAAADLSKKQMETLIGDFQRQSRIAQSEIQGQTAVQAKALFTRAPQREELLAAQWREQMRQAKFAKEQTAAVNPIIAETQYKEAQARAGSQYYLGMRGLQAEEENAALQRQIQVIETLMGHRQRMYDLTTHETDAQKRIEEAYKNQVEEANQLYEVNSKISRQAGAIRDMAIEQAKLRKEEAEAEVRLQRWRAGIIVPQIETGIEVRGYMRQLNRPENQYNFPRQEQIIGQAEQREYSGLKRQLDDKFISQTEYDQRLLQKQDEYRQKYEQIAENRRVYFYNLDLQGINTKYQVQMRWVNATARSQYEAIQKNYKLEKDKADELVKIDNNRAQHARTMFDLETERLTRLREAEAQHLEQFKELMGQMWDVMERRGIHGTGLAIQTLIHSQIRQVFQNVMGMAYKAIGEPLSRMIPGQWNEKENRPTWFGQALAHTFGEYRPKGVKQSEFEAKYAQLKGQYFVELSGIRNEPDWMSDRVAREQTRNIKSPYDFAKTGAELSKYFENEREKNKVPPPPVTYNTPTEYTDQIVEGILNQTYSNKPLTEGEAKKEEEQKKISADQITKLAENSAGIDSNSTATTANTTAINSLSNKMGDLSRAEITLAEWDKKLYEEIEKLINALNALESKLNQQQGNQQSTSQSPGGFGQALGQFASIILGGGGGPTAALAAAPEAGIESKTVDIDYGAGNVRELSGQKNTPRSADIKRVAAVPKTAAAVTNTSKTAARANFSRIATPKSTGVSSATFTAAEPPVIYPGPSIGYRPGSDTTSSSILSGIVDPKASALISYGPEGYTPGSSTTSSSILEGLPGYENNAAGSSGRTGASIKSTVGKVAGIGVAGYLGAQGIAAGIKQGGARGTLGAVSSAAFTTAAVASMFGPAGAVVAGIAAGVGLIAAGIKSLLGDPVRERYMKMEKAIIEGTKPAPPSMYLTESMGGRELDYNFRGQLRESPVALALPMWAEEKKQQEYEKAYRMGQWKREYQGFLFPWSFLGGTFGQKPKTPGFNEWSQGKDYPVPWSNGSWTPDYSNRPQTPEPVKPTIQVTVTNHISAIDSQDTDRFLKKNTIQLADRVQEAIRNYNHPLVGDIREIVG